MEGHNLVAVYNLREDAERVWDRLIASGIPATDIRLSSVSDDASAAAVTQTVPHERGHSFWDWLLGEDVPEHDRVWYHANLREGRTALSVLVRSDAEREQVADILEEFNPLDLHDETMAGIGGATRISPEVRSGYAAGTADQVRATAAGTTGQTEQIIPVVKEELAVGKTTSERRYRIRTYVVETPVEEQVKLRDERVIVERRPASGTVGSDAGAAMQERVFEVTERREEPVVEKRAREAEEVVVRKEADERVETVRDTVRETKVDVDRGPADRGQNIGSTTPPNRNP
jgi:stress response protein YsnF